MVERRGVVVAKLLDQTSAAGCGSMVRPRRPGSGMATHAQDWLALSLSLVVLGGGGASWPPTARGTLAHAHGRPPVPKRGRSLATWVAEQRLQRRPAACPESPIMPPPPLAVQVRRPSAHLPTGGLAAAAAAATGRDRGRLPQRAVRGGEDGGVSRVERAGSARGRDADCRVCVVCPMWLGGLGAYTRVLFRKHVSEAQIAFSVVRATVPPRTRAAVSTLHRLHAPPRTQAWCRDFYSPLTSFSCNTRRAVIAPSNDK